MNATGPDFPRLLQEFFMRRLIVERGASRRTITSYRDAFELLLRFVERRTGRPSSELSLNDLDAPCVLDFLDHIEQERGNCARTRNARLAAIHSFMRYAALRDPSALPLVQSVLAIPVKRFDQPVLGFLSREEIEAILNAPNRSTWSGKRDAVLLMTLYNSGARVSEITALRVADVLIERQTSLLLHGKGRKERVVPLWKSTVTQLKNWLGQIDRRSESPVFPNRAGKALSRFGVRQRLQRAVDHASKRCPSLAGRRVSPHTFRHNTETSIIRSASVDRGHPKASTEGREMIGDENAQDNPGSGRRR